MTIEEKAKRYEDALEKARQLCAYPTSKPFISDLQDLFPELKESEDERIRKALISILKSDFEKDTEIYGISVGDIIAWLEKQGEKQETQYYCDKEELMHCLGKMVAYWADRHGCSVYEENDLMDYINIRMDAVIHLFNPNACLVDLFDCSDEYRNAYYDGYNKCNREWLKKRGEKKPIIDIPSKEVIFSIWDLGNEWRELTNGRLSEKYGTQLDYIQKHWHESEYYLKAKQSEQKTADVVRSFKVDDWIVGANNVVRVTSLNDELNCYIAVTPNNEEVKIPYHFDDGQGHTCSYHLWTIADAKDGDVLVHSSFMFNDFIFIYNNTSLLQAYCYYYKQINKIVIEDRSHPCPWNMQKVTPATQKQRELLFQKIEEAGYKWDTGNKQLIKLL